MDPSNIAQKLASKIEPFQLKIELVLISIIVIGILSKNSEIGRLLLIIPFNFLSILYFIMAFRLKGTKDKTAIFLNQLIQLSFAIGMLGILFTIQYYPGAAIMMRISIIAMFVGLIFSFISKLKNNELQNFINADIIRIVIFTIVITSLITFGKSNLIVSPSNVEKQEINKAIPRDSLNYKN